MVRYYASVNYAFAQGMLKTDGLSDFDVNIKNSTVSSRVNLNVDLNAGIQLLALQWVYEGRLRHTAAWKEHQTSLIAMSQAQQASFN